MWLSRAHANERASSFGRRKDRREPERSDEMHIQVVTFHLKDLPEDAYRQACGQIAPSIADVPGLISKVFLANAATNTYGGVYTWRDRASMEAFKSSDIFRGVASNPSFADLRSEDFGVLEEPTRISRGLAAVAA
jgi:heme-degrading monooxygenase HmoA